MQSQREGSRGIHILKTQICAQRVLSYGLTPHGPRIKTLAAVPGFLQSRFGIHSASNPQQAWDPLHICELYLVVPLWLQQVSPWACAAVKRASWQSQLAKPVGENSRRYKHHRKLDELKRSLVIRKRQGMREWRRQGTRERRDKE